MLQLKNKKKIYFYLLSFLLLSTILNIRVSNFLLENFKINKIVIKNDVLEVKKKIVNKTNYLINKNILKIQEGEIKKKLSDLKYLENIIIRKNYPSSLIIEAKMTKLVGITYFNQKKYYVGENGKFILENKISNKKKLPIIFGKFDIDEFLKLQSDLDKLNINPNNITKYYYHKNKRWDLHLAEEVVLMLPNKNLKKNFEIFNYYYSKNKIKKKTIIDLRIPDRLIVSNEQR